MTLHFLGQFLRVNPGDRRDDGLSAPRIEQVCKAEVVHCPYQIMGKLDVFEPALP